MPFDTATVEKTTQAEQKGSNEAPLANVDDFYAAIKSGRNDVLEQLQNGSAGARAVMDARSNHAAVFSNTNNRNRVMAALGSALEQIQDGKPLPQARRTVAQVPVVGASVAAKLQSANDFKALYVAGTADVLTVIRDLDLSPREPAKPPPQDKIEPPKTSATPRFPTSPIPGSVQELIGYAENDPNAAEIPGMIAALQQTPLAIPLLEVSQTISKLMPENPSFKEQVQFGKDVEELLTLTREAMKKHSVAAAVTGLGARSSLGSGLARGIIGERNPFNDASDVAERVHLFWAVSRLANLGIQQMMSI